MGGATGHIFSDVIGNRPAFGMADRYFWSTDEHILYKDTGAAWVKVAVADHPDLDNIPASFTPSAHKATHEDTGVDEISVAGLLGKTAELTTHEADVANPHSVSAAQAVADPAGSAAAVQGNLDTHEGLPNIHHTPPGDGDLAPKAHKATHEDTGGDEISVAGLAGLLADDQHVLDAEVLLVAAALVHAARHQNGGADEISVAGLSGLLADDQHVLDAEVLLVAAALVHAARHENGGDDEISVAGLSGLLADAQTPDAHTLDSHSASRIGKDRMEWTAAKILLGAGVGADPTEIDAPSATKEFFIGMKGTFTTGAVSLTGDFQRARLSAPTHYLMFALKVPHDFTALTHCKVLGIKNTNGTIDWTANTDFAAVGEAYNTNSDSDTANGLAMTDTEIEEVDISDAFTGLAADDYVGIKFILDAISAGTFDVIGLVFRYS